ncbi:ComEC/Rec2 family competence protein [Sphaerisporangium perillae]|uniref:ComEC/Rec2 family competence protein n=1 Tax=Sphaerisporangium perillae TaxID=2935860 RepID=UPI00200BC889|nr:ComEC/Rec2 family competence protein [Sphaerisporangium perillae]
MSTGGPGLGVRPQPDQRRERTAAHGTGSPSPQGALRLVLPALAAWTTALVLLDCSVSTSLATAAAAMTALGTTAFHLHRRRRKRALSEHPKDQAGRSRVGAWLGVLGCVAAVAVAVAFRVHAATSGPVAGLAEKRAAVTVEMSLDGDPRILPGHRGLIRQDRVIVNASVLIVEAPGPRVATTAPVIVFARGAADWVSLLPSQRIRVHGRLTPADPGELTAGVLSVKQPPEVLSGPSPPQRVAGALRAGLRQAAAVLPPAERGLLPGLVVGDLSLMDEQVKNDLKTAGLSHLTAVSGANLAIIAGTVLAFGRLTGLPLAIRAVLAVVAMVCFTVVARPSPSVLRALVMGSVAAVALGTGRAKDGVTALSAAVLGLILFDPALAPEYGFALSVFATGGILVLAPRWRDRMARRMPRWAAEAVAVPCAAQAAVTPLLVLMSGELEPVAIPANLLAGPAVAPATVLGFAASLVAPASVEAARWLVRPAGYAVGWIVWVARQAAAVPVATLSWPGGAIGLLLLAAVAGLGWCLLRRAAWRLTVCAIAAGLGLAMLFVRPVVGSWPPRGWLMVTCDIGQGDALVLSAGEARAVVVDTGPDPVSVDRCLRTLGIEQVPLLILTHPHFDHVGGLDGVFRGRPVGAVVVSPGHEPLQESARVSADLARRRVPAWVASPGMRWHLGPVELRILGPAADAVPAGPGEGSMANNASVVVHAQWAAGSALLSGDVETEAQAELVRLGLPRADVLKVPHHGSARQDPAFLAATGARAALISVGAGNDYGHPAPLTVQRLHGLGMSVYRTDRHGDVAIVTDQGRLAIVPRGR